MAGARLDIRVLGDCTVSADGVVALDERFRRRKALALLKLIALQPTLSLPREQVLDQLWSDIEPDAAANNLHKAVYYLRIAFESAGLDEPVELSGGVVRLVPADVDVARFREAARRARASRINAGLYRTAISLYGGELLPHDIYEPWTEGPRADLTELHERLVLELARIHEIRGDAQLALETLSPLEERGTNEEVQRAVMRAHAALGNREAALRAYQRCEAALRREIDVAPSEETRALRDEIMQGRGRASTRAGRVPESELIGRTQEMQRLLAALDETARGSGGIVLLGGEPGIGKTRLAEELAFHAQVRDVRVLWARCDPSEATPSYWPWIEALREFLDRPGDGGSPDLARILPGAEGGGTLQDAPDRGRFRLQDAIATFLRRATRERPMLLVLDDLHDADIASLQLLLHVARSVHDARLLIVGTFRDVELTPEHALRAILGDLVREHLKAQITLTGLSPDEVAEFVQATAGVAPTDRLALTLHRETEGNPFFVKECALMLEPGATEHRAGADARFDVPASVREAISRRLASLSEACRDVIGMGAVIGHRFDVALLRRVSKSTRGTTLLDAIDEATRRHIIRDDDGDGSSMTFCHGLIRQTIYEQIAAGRRSAIHRAVGEAIEASGDNERNLAPLAYHFYEAALGDGDAGKAIEYARRAGDADVAVFAWESARQHWEMARRLLENTDDREALADLLERLPNLIFSIGQDLERGISYLERAVAIRDELGQVEEAAEDHSRLGILLSTHFGDAARYAAVTDLSRALEHYRAAEPVLGAGADRPSVAFFHAGLATVAFVGVHVPEGLASSQRAMDVAERLGMRPVRATAALLRAGVLKLSGRFSEANALFQDAWEIADEGNDTTVAFYAATNLADWTEGYAAGRGDLVATELSRPRNASASSQRTTLIHDIASGLARNGRVAEARAKAADAPDSDMMRAWLSLYEGAWEDVGPAFHNGLDLIRQVGNRSAVANRCDHLATLYLMRDEHDAAVAALEEELAIGLDGHATLIELRSRAELALISAHAGDLECASAQLARCHEILGNGEDWGRKAGRVHIAESVVAALKSELSLAEDRLARATTIFAERDLPWDQADAHVQCARALDKRGHDSDAATHRAAAVAIYRRINAARPWIDRAERR